jgi:hypothetical protein
MDLHRQQKDGCSRVQPPFFFPTIFLFFFFFYFPLVGRRPQSAHQTTFFFACWTASRHFFSYFIGRETIVEYLMECLQLQKFQLKDRHSQTEMITFLVKKRHRTVDCNKRSEKKQTNEKKKKEKGNNTSGEPRSFHWSFSSRRRGTRSRYRSVRTVERCSRLLYDESHLFSNQIKFTVLRT